MHCVHFSLSENKEPVTKEEFLCREPYTGLELVREIAEKELVPILMPMVMDKEEQKKYHRAGAARMESFLDQEKNVVFLTLGDPTIYSTFSYIRQIVETDGYQTQIVNGIPSFCAAAAALGMSLTEWKEPLHIIPTVHQTDFRLNLPGNTTTNGQRLPNCVIAGRERLR